MVLIYNKSFYGFVERPYARDASGACGSFAALAPRILKKVFEPGEPEVNPGNPEGSRRLSEGFAD